MAALNAGFAYGSLCSGGDILMAEAALAAGIELHVVLPYRAEDFVQSSVSPGWEARFAACMARARTVSYVIDNDVLRHDCVKALCSSHAMGMARRHADALATGVCQLAIWNGAPARAVATAAAEVAKWSALGLPSVIIPPHGAPYRLTAAAAAASRAYQPGRGAARLFVRGCAGVQQTARAAYGVLRPDLSDGPGRCDRAFCAGHRLPRHRRRRDFPGLSHPRPGGGLRHRHAGTLGVLRPGGRTASRCICNCGLRSITGRATPSMIPS